jgi:hypothetical protein
MIAARWMEGVVANAGRHVVVEGVRNPLDLLHLVRSEDVVIDVGGEGGEGWERDGLAAIRACRPLLLRAGVRWTDAPRHFATIPEPLEVAVPSGVLHGDDRPGVVIGRLVALESYPGELVTGCWVSHDGGMFHDLPMASLVGRSGFEGHDDAAEYARAMPYQEHCYSVAAQGSPVIEMSPCVGPVAIFDRSRQRIGTGSSGWMIHWPDANLLLHIIEEEMGRILLWPPHKLMWSTESGSALPSWRKLR